MILIEQWPRMCPLNTRARAFWQLTIYDLHQKALLALYFILLVLLSVELEYLCILTNVELDYTEMNKIF